MPERQFARVKFGELLDQWWENEGRHRRAPYRYCIGRVREAFGHVKASEMKPIMIRDFLDGIAKEHSGAYANSHRTVIRSTFRYALQNDLFDRNPTNHTSVLPENQRAGFFRPGEFQRLLEACDGDAEVECFVWLCVTGAYRTSEVIQRPWTDVCLDGPLPHMIIEKTKNGSSKILPLSSPVVEALQRLPSFGRSKYLFPSRPTNRYPNPKQPFRWGIRKQFQRACEAAGLGHRLPHDLRRTTASLLLMSGVSEAVTRKITGHRSAALERYQHLTPGFREATVEHLATILQGDQSQAKSQAPTETQRPVAARRRRKGLKPKRESGRPERTRTADLYRVKVAL